MLSLRKGKNSDAVVDAFLSLDEYKNAKCIMTYVSFNDEVDTFKIIDDAINKGKRVAVPKVLGDDMFASEINSLNDLEAGRFGILEPKSFKEISNIDICIVPGLAFDKKLNRLGYGKGYYDRFLAGLNVLKIGLCYIDSVLDEIPVYETDIAMDLIVTEKGRLLK